MKEYLHWKFTCLPSFFLALLLGMVTLSTVSMAAGTLDYPVIFSRIPLDAAEWFGDSRAEGMIPSDFFEGSELVLLKPSGGYRVITNGFHSACDPEVSFDGNRILFSGKRKENDRWNIFEADLSAGTVRQITSDFGNCRNPRYMSTFYTIVSPEPWYTLAFVSDVSGERSEFGGLESTNLYSCKLDGSGLQRLTYNPSHDFDPLMLPDGRILYSTWQRNLPEHGRRGRIELFSINSDGTDISVFNRQGKAVKHMATITTENLVVFVESDALPWDGAGSLGSIRLNRYSKSYEPLQLEPGLYHSPSPLPDGRLLVSRREPEAEGSHDLYLLNPSDQRLAPLLTDKRFHLMQAKAVVERKVPDGRSSVVNESDPHGQFFCLDITTSDSREFSEHIMEEARKVRFIEGVPATGTGHGGEEMLQKRILGEIDLSPDGSFFVEVPANIPIKVQIIDGQGMSLRSGTWIWVRNHEPRGCIGCHEDPELVPENRMVDAVKKDPYNLTLPPRMRRSVTLHDNLLPVIEQHCSTASCHGDSSNPALHLPAAVDTEEESLEIWKRLTADDPGGRRPYVIPGRARTSPLIWHITGNNTAKKWDPDSLNSYNGIMQGPETLSAEEIRMFVEWIDLGAQWKMPVDSGGSGSRSAEAPGR